MASAPQPLIGQDLTGTLLASFPTPANDVQLTANIEGNVENYLQTLYGSPPPQGTNPNHMLVNETPIDWRYYKRLYVTDRVNEDTYNASISYSAEATAYPIFTRDYIVRRASYVAKAKLSTLEGLVNATVTAAGSGYTFATVSLIGGTGSGGAVSAIVSGGKVVQLVITAEGNYTVVPTISFAGDGSGATGTVSLQPASAVLVKEDYIRQPDSNLDGLYVLVRRVYETLPGPVLSGDHVDEITKIRYPYSKQIVASGSVTGGITGAAVIALTIANAGTGFTGNPTLTFSAPPSGTTATGTATFSAASPAGKLGSITVTATGSGFTSQPSVGISDGGPGSGATATAVLLGVPIGSVNVTAGGSGYTDAPSAAISDTGTGSGALAQSFLTPSTVDTVTVSAGGTGYTVATVAFVGGGGTGAAATAHITGTAISSITIDSAGTGYTSAPQVVISGDGTGAAAHSNLVATSLASVSVTSTGNLYQNASIAFSGGGGSGATASVLLSPTQIFSITLSAVGSGYTSPVVAITGGGGSGATATASIATGTITSVAITNAGSGYTSSPTITVTGGGGTGAVILATIGSLTWVEVEPLTSVKDMVMRTTVDLTSLPTTITFPESFTVQRADTNISTLIVQPGTEGRVAVGLNEISIRGGQGPTLAYRKEMYMTDSQFAAYIPGAFSIGGKSLSTTMYRTNVDGNGFPQVFTFRPLTTNSGTSPGIIELTDQKKPYGIRFVVEKFLTIAS